MASEKFKEWTSPEGLILITGWCREGYTNKMLAERMGITSNTFYDWCRKSKELKEAIKQGKEVADYMVENALFKAALGFEYTETKTHITGKPDKHGERNVKVEKTVKYFPPNVTAIAIWLNNRKPDQWKRNRDNLFEMNDNDSNITVNIIKNSDARKKEQEEKEAREREGIKTETVEEDEFEEYQHGYVDEKFEEDEEEVYGKNAKNIGVEDEEDWSEFEEDEDWDE